MGKSRARFDGATQAHDNLQSIDVNATTAWAKPARLVLQIMLRSARRVTPGLQSTTTEPSALVRVCIAVHTNSDPNRIVIARSCVVCVGSK